MKIEQFFYENPVFRFETFAEWKLMQGKIKSNSINTTLLYYVKAGRIKSIRRKLYAVVPPNQSSESVVVDPYLIAGKATDDAVLAYHTALELMGAAYSTFGQFTYLTKHKSKPFEFQGQWFQPVTVPAALQKKQKTSIGIDTIDRQGVALKITNRSRTFVDVVDRIELCGGWEEVSRSISNIAALKIDEVINYCLELESKCLNAKVGYLLSQRKDAFTVKKSCLSPLLLAAPKMPQYAAKRSKEKFQLVKPWNILLPVSILRQSWEDPHVDI